MIKLIRIDISVAHKTIATMNMEYESTPYSLLYTKKARERFLLVFAGATTTTKNQ